MPPMPDWPVDRHDRPDFMPHEHGQVGQPGGAVMSGVPVTTARLTTDYDPYEEFSVTAMI